MKNYKHLDWFIKDRLEKGHRKSTIIARAEQNFTFSRQEVEERYDYFTKRFKVVVYRLERNNTRFEAGTFTVSENELVGMLRALQLNWTKRCRSVQEIHTLPDGHRVETRRWQSDGGGDVSFVAIQLK